MAYSPLNSSQNLIRLLHLSPASNRWGTIHGRFSVALLDDRPVYEALSYAWGDLNDTSLIEVDGHSVPITRNLQSALKHLQLQDQERTLWVDALCINQTDLAERMHQVSLMGSIYGQASPVVVWLGEGWDGSEIAMEFLRRLGEDENLHLDPDKHPSIDVHGLNMCSPELCGNLIQLFDVPWWHRLVRRMDFKILCPQYLDFPFLDSFNERLISVLQGFGARVNSQSLTS
jgi:hypothetical protein